MWSLQGRLSHQTESSRTYSYTAVSSNHFRSWAPLYKNLSICLSIPIYFFLLRSNHRYLTIDDIICILIPQLTLISNNRLCYPLLSTMIVLVKKFLPFLCSAIKKIFQDSDLRWYTFSIFYHDLEGLFTIKNHHILLIFQFFIVFLSKLTKNFLNINDVFMNNKIVL